MKLVIDNLSKQYKGRPAVERFSAELTDGVYALLGPNGSGKTTLLRMLADVLKPSSGRILLNGRDISVLDKEYREIIGYLPQEFGVYKNFTAERFLMYFASLKGFTKKEAVPRVAEVLKLVNLEQEQKRKIGGFSGGMKRRLGIAQALLNDPKILIVDEPTAGLDPKERIRFRNLLSEISGDRIVILSTHIVSDIEYIAKEIFLLRKGELVEKNTLEGLLQKLDGKVWGMKANQEELPALQQKFKVGNIQRKIDGIELRIVSGKKPGVNAEPVPAVLEDVYLYYFDEEAAEVVQA